MCGLKTLITRNYLSLVIKIFLNFVKEKKAKGYSETEVDIRLTFLFISPSYQLLWQIRVIVVYST